MGDDLSLDVGLNPHEDPRVLWGEIALEDLDLVAEEMLNLGLKPDQISEEAYLKARRQYVAAKVRRVWSEPSAVASDFRPLTR